MAGLSTLTSQTRGQHETTEIDFLAKKKTNSEDTFPQYKESQNLLAGSQCAGHQDLEGQEDHIGEEKSEQGQLLVVRLGVKQFSLEADFWQYFPTRLITPSKNVKWISHFVLCLNSSLTFQPSRSL